MENEKLEEIFLVLEDKLDKTVNVLQSDYAAIRAGRANPHILDKIQVEAYGAMSPLQQLGNIAVTDARCLVISPWDKSLLKSIEKALLASNIGITPTNDGTVIRLVFRAHGRAQKGPRKTSPQNGRGRQSRGAQRAQRGDGSSEKDEDEQGNFGRREQKLRTRR